ncbi:Uma2 family endonuclease [Dyadobacter sp. 22481]|uniref:Uma2 family endonuclease n=1 Tax=Dyadobacter sp. 22481 TaxID=3453926 RepID=UPI003F847C3E
MIASLRPGFDIPENALEESIPTSLIREIIDGKPYYFKGYPEVLAGNKDAEGVMGCSTLQAFIVTFLVRVLLRSIDENQYFIATNEPGLHIDRKNNLASDIMVFDYNILTTDQINLNYAQVPPAMCIEVDTRVELQDATESEYVTLKTMKLLEFGVAKVIWFFTETKKVMIATPGSWTTFDWNDEVVLMPGALCNIGQYLRSKGSKYA